MSFNNDRRFGSFFRYISEYRYVTAFYDDLSDGKNTKIDLSQVDVSMNGIEFEDREFFAAIAEKREPSSRLAQTVPAYSYRTLDRLEQQLGRVAASSALRTGSG